MALLIVRFECAGEPTTRPSGRLAAETLGAKLFLRLVRLLQITKAHAVQDVVGFRELDLAVLDHLDVVAPRIAEVDRAARLDVDARVLQSAARRLLVVDDEAEVPVRVGRLRAAGGERDELVAHVDEGHPAGAPAQLELEDAPVELERLLDIAHLERDVVQADEPSTCHTAMLVRKEEGRRRRPFLPSLSEELPAEADFE